MSDELVDFSEIAAAYWRAENVFTSALLECDPESYIDWQDTTTDEYDNSVELKEVPSVCRLSEKQQRFLFDSGFSLCWLCHSDGWETFYRFGRGRREDGKWIREFVVEDGFRTNRNEVPK